MNIPIVIGWPQLLLLVVGVIGVGLLISVVLSLGTRSRAIDEDEDEDYRRTQGASPPRRQRRFRFGRGLGGALLVGLALSLLWLTFLVQSYLGLTGDIQVARVHATKIANEAHMMTLTLTLYDKDGHQTSNTYLVQGDEWELQGDFIKFPTWLNIFGLHTGYKLTRLEGRFDDLNLERNSKHTVIALNGGDDDFFKTVHPQTWLAPLVEATYGNAVIQGTGDRGDATFDVLVSQTGLYAKPAQ